MFSCGISRVGTGQLSSAPTSLPGSARPWEQLDTPTIVWLSWKLLFDGTSWKLQGVHLSKMKNKVPALLKCQ